MTGVEFPMLSGRIWEFLGIVGRGNEALSPNGLKRKMKVKCKGFGGSMYLDSMNLPSLQKKKKKKKKKKSHRKQGEPCDRFPEV